jgi:hypothetical protein
VAVASVAFGILSVCAPARLHAQVGHDPARSPFRDIVARQHLTLFGGRFAGSRTTPGVGARPGLITGGRFETRLSGPIDLVVTFGRINSSRIVVNPMVSDTSPNRRRGPVDYALIAGDLALALNLTGAKSWRGFAPYVSVGLGLVAPTESVVDTGGYKASSNFALVPGLGTRYYLSRRWALRFEARDYYYRYEWPLSFYTGTDAQGNPVEPVLAATTPSQQWTHNVAFTFGLTYAFTF